MRVPQSAPVERMFEYSLLGLLTSGFLSLAAAGAVDLPIFILTAAAVLTRAAAIAGWIRIRVAPSLLSAIALAYIGFYPLDYYFLSHDFLKATVHGFCFIAAVKILTGRGMRDWLYIAAVALVELAGSAFLSLQPAFFACLTLFLFFASSAFATADVLRGFHDSPQVATGRRKSLTPGLAILALLTTAGIVILAAGLFLVVPRTARAAATFFPGATQRLSGFTNVVDLGGFGTVAQDRRAVMHVHSYKGSLPATLKWRGTALARFDGRRWSESLSGGQHIPSPGGTAQVADTLQRSRLDGRRLIYRADIAAPDSGLLFIAGIPEFINLNSPQLNAPRLTRSGDGAFRVSHTPGEPIGYEVSSLAGAPLPEPLTRADRARYLQLPPVDTRIWPLAREWTRQGATAFDRAAEIERHLRNEFRYTLRAGDAGARDPLAHFLFNTRSGYCEYFASAMAVMLRIQGIPSRVVTGFQSGYYNDISDSYVIRASDAHAWVEAWFEGRGWITFDPTPAAVAPREGLFGRLDMYLDAMDSAWQQWVVGYDPGQQVELAARVQRAVRIWGAEHSGSSSWRKLSTRWEWIVLLPALAAALFFFMTRIARSLRPRLAARKAARKANAGGASASDIALLYRRALRTFERRGFRKPEWLTPLEFVQSLPEAERDQLLSLTRLYNSARYGANHAAALELARLSSR